MNKKVYFVLNVILLVTLACGSTGATTNSPYGWFEGYGIQKPVIGFGFRYEEIGITSLVFVTDHCKFNIPRSVLAHPDPNGSFSIVQFGGDLKFEGKITGDYASGTYSVTCSPTWQRDGTWTAKQEQ